MTCADIMQVAARHFGIRVCDIIGPGRNKTLARARNITMAICRERLELSYPELAQEFGGRDHTTIICGVKRARAYRMSQQTWADDFNAIERELMPWREEREIEKLEMGA